MDITLLFDQLHKSFDVSKRDRQMAEQVGERKPVLPFEYEFVDRDSDSVRTVVATPNPDGPWIDPASLKLKHRIGRGTFGDVRLATLHQSSAEFDEYHELALKVLHPLEKDHTLRFMDKFQELFFRCRGFQNVCWLHGITIIDGKVKCLENEFGVLLYLYFLDIILVILKLIP